MSARIPVAPSESIAPPTGPSSNNEWHKETLLVLDVIHHILYWRDPSLTLQVLLISLILSALGMSKAFERWFIPVICATLLGMVALVTFIQFLERFFFDAKEKPTKRLSDKVRQGVISDANAQACAHVINDVATCLVDIFLVINTIRTLQVIAVLMALQYMAATVPLNLFTASIAVGIILSFPKLLNDGLWFLRCKSWKGSKIPYVNACNNGAGAQKEE